MAQPMYTNWNGKIIREENVHISPNNRSFRYGDGCFETIKMVNGTMLLAPYHFERLFSSLQQLHFDVPNYLTPDYLLQQITNLVYKNGHQQLARIRLTVFRGDGGLYDPENHFPNYLIQSWALNPANNQLNENGLVIDVYQDARKVCDAFSHIKSNNYLSYAMAAFWAKQQQLNDAILLNPYNHVADATIANVFVVQNGVVKTPALTEGAVNGNMRRYLLQCMQANHIACAETTLAETDLHQASEIFLTNAIYGIKWVRQLGNYSHYQHTVAADLHERFVKGLIGCC